MSKSIKEKENIYRQARKQASKFNDKFKSMEGASEFLGIGRDQFSNYELGLCKQVPVDIVVKMADAYNSPELLNHYCCNECPIGKLTISPVSQENIDNIFKLSINIFNVLVEGKEIGKQLLDIADDGEITEDEKPRMDYIVNKMKRISGLYNDLIIAIEKSTIEGGN